MRTKNRTKRFANANFGFFFYNWHFFNRLRTGASVHAVSEGDFSETIVHCASVHPSPAVVYALLDARGAQFARVDAEGSNAMHILVGFDSVFSKYAKATEWDLLQPAIDFLAKKGLDPCLKSKASGKSALEAVQLSKRLKDGVKAKAMEQMKRISAKFESEWMKKALSSNIHPIFGMLQQKDPLDKLEHFLSTNDVSRQLTDKLETPLHVLFRPDSKCADFQKIIKAIMLLMKNADLSQASTNLWGRTVMDYIKYYSNLGKGDKEQLIAQLNHDKV